MTDLELENEELKASIQRMRGDAERAHDERMRLAKTFKEQSSVYMEVLQALYRETKRADNASEECARLKREGQSGTLVDELRDQLLAKDDRIEELEGDVLKLQATLKLIIESAERSYRASKGDL